MSKNIVETAARPVRSPRWWPRSGPPAWSTPSRRRPVHRVRPHRRGLRQAPAGTVEALLATGAADHGAHLPRRPRPGDCGGRGPRAAPTVQGAPADRDDGGITSATPTSSAPTSWPTTASSTSSTACCCPQPRDQPKGHEDETHSHDPCAPCRGRSGGRGDRRLRQRLDYVEARRRQEHRRDRGRGRAVQDARLAAAKAGLVDTLRPAAPSPSSPRPMRRSQGAQGDARRARRRSRPS